MLFHTSLAKDLQHILDQETVPLSAGIEITDLLEDTSIISFNAHHLFKPASTSKILTAVAALDVLGPDYRFKTCLFIDGKDAVLRFAGDPTLTLSDITQLFRLLKQSGVDRLFGDIRVVYHVSHLPPHPSCFSIEDTQFSYGAAIHPYTINKNMVRLFIEPPRPGDKEPSIHYEGHQVVYPVTNDLLYGRPKKTEELERDNVRFTGEMIHLFGTIQPSYKEPVPVFVSIPVSHQHAYVILNIQEALRQVGIEFKGQYHFMSDSGINDCGMGGFVHLSRPLIDIVQEGMHESDNLIANSLLAAISQRHVSEARQWKEAANWVKKRVERILGIRLKNFYLHEGSGLSPLTLFSAHRMNCILRALVRHPFFKTILPRLFPQSGKEGTLLERPCRLPKGMIFRGKTGSLSNAANIAGYIFKENIPIATIVVYLNNIPEDRSPPQRIIDQIIRTVGRNIKY